jgi:hypothetical protein
MLPSLPIELLKLVFFTLSWLSVILSKRRIWEADQFSIRNVGTLVPRSLSAKKYLRPGSQRRLVGSNARERRPSPTNFGDLAEKEQPEEISMIGSWPQARLEVSLVVQRE